MIQVILWVLAARAHPEDDDSDHDGHEDQSEYENCGLRAVTDPTTFVGARERCDGLDNDCDGEIDDGGACVDEVMPCYQVEGEERAALDGDPCLLEANPGDGCGSMSDSGSAFVLVGLLAVRRRD
jgi:hypothetical protein